MTDKPNIKQSDKQLACELGKLVEVYSTTGLAGFPLSTAYPMIASYREQVIREAAAAFSKHDKRGREWVPGSLWDALTQEGAQRVLELLREKHTNERDDDGR